MPANHEQWSLSLLPTATGYPNSTGGPLPAGCPPCRSKMQQSRVSSASPEDLRWGLCRAALFCMLRVLKQHWAGSGLALHRHRWSGERSPRGAGVAPPSLRFVVVGFDPDLLLFWTRISKQASCRSVVPLRFPFPQKEQIKPSDVDLRRVAARDGAVSAGLSLVRQAAATGEAILFHLPYDAEEGEKRWL